MNWSRPGNLSPVEYSTGNFQNFHNIQTFVYAYGKSHKSLSLDLEQCFHKNCITSSDLLSTVCQSLLQFSIWQKIQLTCIIGRKTYQPLRRTLKIFWTKDVKVLLKKLIVLLRPHYRLKMVICNCPSLMFNKSAGIVYHSRLNQWTIQESFENTFGR